MQNSSLNEEGNPRIKRERHGDTTAREREKKVKIEVIELDD
jgi:hypothetical protein